MAAPGVNPRLLLSVPWRQLRNRPRASLALGVLGATGNILLRLWGQQLLRPAVWQEAVQSWITSGLIPYRLFLTAAGSFILLSLLGWLLVLLAEGGLIALALQRARPLFHARRWLASFIVVDTLVFLPLLVVTVLALLLFIGLGTGSLLAAASSDDPAPILSGGLGIALLCMAPLLLLAIPVGVLTVALRLLAFRAVAVEGLDGRAALRRAWQLLRTQTMRLLLYALLLFGLTYLVSSVAGLVYLLELIPALTGLVETGRLMLWGGWLIALLGLFLDLALRAPWFAYVALAWTQAYQLTLEGEGG